MKLRYILFSFITILMTQSSLASRNPLDPNDPKNWELEVLDAFQEMTARRCFIEAKGKTLLGINETGLSALPPQLDTFVTLTEVILQKNCFSAFPEVLTRLPALRRLDLSHNWIEEIPQSVSKMTALRTLDLQSNPLKTPPEAIGTLSQLETLNISLNTELQTLPRSTSNIVSLKSLKAFTCGLHAFPEGLEKMTSLTELDLKHNQIRTLTRKLLGLPRLGTLNLAGCPLVLIVDDVLKALNLLGTDISQFPEITQEEKDNAAILVLLKAKRVKILFDSIK